MCVRRTAPVDRIGAHRAAGLYVCSEKVRLTHTHTHTHTHTYTHTHRERERQRERDRERQRVPVARSIVDMIARKTRLTSTI